MPSMRMLPMKWSTSESLVVVVVVVINGVSIVVG